jgi:hypothetical protein
VGEAVSKVMRVSALLAVPCVAVAGTMVLSKPESMVEAMLWLVACTVLLPLPFGVVLGVLLPLRTSTLAALGYGVLITLLHVLPVPSDVELADFGFPLEQGVTAFLLAWFYAWAARSLWRQWRISRTRNAPGPPANKRIEPTA